MSKEELILKAINTPRGTVIAWFKNNQITYALYKHRGGKKSRVSIQKDGSDVMRMKRKDTIGKYVSRLYDLNVFWEFIDG